MRPPPAPSTVAGPPKGPLVLLGLLSIATMAGPFVIFLVIRGGTRPDWPPDRAVEWWKFGVVFVAVVVLMAGCVTAGGGARKEGRMQENPSTEHADTY